MGFVESKQHLIIREVKKPRGSSSRLIRYYECNCLTKECNSITYRDVYAFKKWSGYCKKCSDLKKINQIDINLFLSKTLLLKQVSNSLFSSIVPSFKINLA